jgi:hypothetical protein
MSAPKSAEPAQNGKPAVPAQLFRGTVKQINSADSVVIKSLVVKDGRNLEKTVMLGGINVPRLGRRTGNGPDSAIENDQVNIFVLSFSFKIFLCLGWY